MSIQAREFPLLLNRLATLMDVEIAVNAMTEADEVSSDVERTYKAVSVPYADLENHGASKALFIRIMQALVLCGSPDQLRIEWDNECFGIDPENETVWARLMVVGHSEFGDHSPVESVADIDPALKSTGLTILGESSIQMLNLPDPKPHTYTTPVMDVSAQALFVSLMLAIYDVGQPGEVELHWRGRPASEHNVARNLWTAHASALITKKSRILTGRP